ncbi:hypothetical protein GN958_ATG11935 [Phytophthora infestans]|uniref:Uncharacterized protein n=1 Tax=Phytophthora infestans TaxID=4787 RepID=A0A8S9UKK3_PHYIN|nr:hypothetical protein GN958_ATG21319 [Phytophthora infestans]KAF4138978.1 hypothetical protein GN958_ATG11935 [Phytophthora infestans]
MESASLLKLRLVKDGRYSLSKWERLEARKVSSTDMELVESDFFDTGRIAIMAALSIVFKIDGERISWPRLNF